MKEWQHALLKLIEECCEASVVASKCMQFGFDGKHPAMNVNNEELLCQELNDVIAHIKLLKNRHGLRFKDDEHHQNKKIEKSDSYLEYLKTLKTVTGETYE